jgi:hypothetical protein
VGGHGGRVGGLTHTTLPCTLRVALLTQWGVQITPCLLHPTKCRHTHSYPLNGPTPRPHQGHGRREGGSDPQARVKPQAGSVGQGVPRGGGRGSSKGTGVQGGGRGALWAYS